MEHCIHVFIAQTQVFNSITTRFPNAHVVPLNQGFAMIPLIEEFYDEIPDAQDPESSPGYDHFELLGPKVNALGLLLSQDGPIAYCETDCSEDTTAQRAIAWNQKKIICPPNDFMVDGPIPPEQRSKEPINAALRAIGVVKDRYADEFSALQLEKYGNDLDWVEQPAE
jgi:hypothetical protein